MNAIRGGVGVLLIVASFWLCPPDRDPIVMSLPGYLKFLIFVAIAAMGIAGLLVLTWGVFAGAETKLDESASADRTEVKP